VSVSAAIRIREAITSKINLSIRAEPRRQINGRYSKKAAQVRSSPVLVCYFFLFDLRSWDKTMARKRIPGSGALSQIYHHLLC
jgi:hypothetical protein